LPHTRFDHDTLRRYVWDRMASNNLPVGAQALLDAGADPKGNGGAMKTARQAEASSVITVLKAQPKRAEDKIVASVTVFSEVHPEIEGQYSPRDGKEEEGAPVCTCYRCSPDTRVTPVRNQNQVEGGPRCRL